MMGVSYVWRKSRCNINPAIVYHRRGKANATEAAARPADTFSGRGTQLCAVGESGGPLTWLWTRTTLSPAVSSSTTVKGNRSGAAKFWVLLRRRHSPPQSLSYWLARLAGLVVTGCGPNVSVNTLRVRRAACGVAIVGFVNLLTD